MSITPKMQLGKTLIANDKEVEKMQKEYSMENNTNNSPVNAGLNDATTSENNTPAKEQTFDYEQGYKKAQLEIEKLKNAISKTNSENAEYKRKEIEKMTDEQKKAKEQEELLNRLNQLEAENKSMKLKDELLSEGFSTDEAKQLIEAEFSVSSIAKIVKARVEEAKKAAKATQIVNQTPTPMGKGSTDGEKTESLAEQLAKSRFATDTKKIKDYYKKA